MVYITLMDKLVYTNVFLGSNFFFVEQKPNNHENIEGLTR